ncbi:hypothetical protein TNCV_4711 [Trichonephila clavipes]|nr:hypothetical protein TNCV_4711 [Trichonephila clavipes]
MREHMRVRDRVIDLIGRTWKNPDVLENPRAMRIRVVNRLRGDRPGLEGSQLGDTLPVLSKEQLQRTRRTTGGAEEYGDRQSTTEQPEEKEPQCGNIRRRSGR